MPLDATNFVQNGTNTHQDHLQFFNLLTGVMADQPVSIANTLSATALVTTGGGISAPSGTPIVFSTGGAARWSILNTGQLEASADGALNIGSPATGRPNNIYIAGALSVGSTNERIRNPVNAAGNLSVESADGNLMLSGAGSVQLGYNAYWDGTNWQRFNVANNAVFWWVGASGVAAFTGPAGANPLGTLSQVFSVSTTGALTIPGALSAGSLTATSGGASITGNATVSGSLQVQGAASVAGWLQLPDSSTYIAGSAGNIYMRSANLIVQTNTGAPGPLGCGSFSASTATISSTLTVSGTTSTNGGISNNNLDIYVVRTYYGMNNSVYMTNDGSTWTVTGGVNWSGNLTSAAQFSIGGTSMLIFAVSGYGIGGVAGWAGVYTNGSFQVNGGYYYYEGSRAVATYWNGGQICITHSIIVNSGYIYWTSTSVALYWQGQGLQCSHGFWATSANFSSTIYTNGWNLGWANNFGGNIACSGTMHLYGQYCAYQSYNNSNLNAFLCPNAANYTGQGLAWQWATWACVDHAVEYALRCEPIADALCIVNAITGWSYDHSWMENGNQRPRRDEDGEIICTPTFGFKASEVARYLPELVGFNPETGEPETIDLDRMGVVLWEAFKQHAARTDARLEQLERMTL